MLELFTSTRLQIMLKLSERPHTLSEIAKATGFSKTAIIYHLEKLEKNGLVERLERGKWVYYRLTNKGFSKMKVEALTTLVSISVSILSSAGLVARLMLKFREEEEFRKFTVPKAPTPTDFPEVAKLVDLWFLPEIFLAIIAAVSLAIFLHLRTR